MSLSCFLIEFPAAVVAKHQPLSYVRCLLLFCCHCHSFCLFQVRPEGQACCLPFGNGCLFLHLWGWLLFLRFCRLHFFALGLNLLDSLNFRSSVGCRIESLSLRHEDFKAYLLMLLYCRFSEHSLAMPTFN